MNLMGQEKAPSEGHNQADIYRVAALSLVNLASTGIYTFRTIDFGHFDLFLSHELAQHRGQNESSFFFFFFLEANQIKTSFSSCLKP